MSLRENVHTLVRTHLATSSDGAITRQPALLDQLTTACRTNFGASGSGAGGAGLLVNSKAVQLDREIREDALYIHFELYGHEYRGTLKDLVATWPVIELNGEMQAYIELRTAQWVWDIENLLAQRRPPFYPSTPCPACGQRFHGPENVPTLGVEYWDNERDRILNPAEWSAACEACGATWSGHKEMKFLQHAIDTATDAGPSVA